MNRSESIFINIPPRQINIYYEAFQNAEFNTVGGDHYVLKLKNVAEFDISPAEYEIVMQQMTDYDTADGKRDGSISTTYANKVFNKGMNAFPLYINTAKFSDEFEKHYFSIHGLVSQGIILGTTERALLPYEPGVFLTSLSMFLSGYSAHKLPDIMGGNGSFFDTPVFLLCDNREETPSFTVYGDGAAKIYLNLCTNHSLLDTESSLYYLYQRHLLRHEDLHTAALKVSRQNNVDVQKHALYKMKDKGMIDKGLALMTKLKNLSVNAKKAYQYNFLEAEIQPLDYTYAPELKVVSELEHVNMLEDLSKPNPESFFIADQEIGVFYVARLAIDARFIGKPDLEAALDSRIKNLFSKDNYALYLNLKELYLAVHEVTEEEVKPLIASQYPSLLKPL